MLRLLLIDDHEIVRLGLKTLLQDFDWLQVVGEAGSAVEAIKQTKNLKPDVVILDIHMPGESGIDACKQITSKYPSTKVIMLTTDADDEQIIGALESGASAYVLKQVGNKQLIHALEAIRDGKSLLDPQVTSQIINKIREGSKQRFQQAFAELSDREMEVLYWVSKGASNANIGERLSLSKKTVGHHVSAILEKLSLGNRVEAATYAVRNHIGDLLGIDEAL